MLNTFLQTYLHLLPLFLSAVALAALLRLPAQLLILYIEKSKWER